MRFCCIFKKRPEPETGAAGDFINPLFLSQRKFLPVSLI